MRKYLFAGAVAGGLLLTGAVPAHADDRPAPAGLLGGLLNPAGGVDPAVESPLGPTVLDVRPGSNSADPSSVTGRVPTVADGDPVTRTGLGEPRTGAAPTARPAAAPVPGTLPQTGAPVLRDLPVRDLLGGGLPLAGGLLPDGAGGAPVTGRESGLLDEGLLGGLGGLLPAPAGDGDGMPVGGTPVDPPAAIPDPADVPAPAVSTPPAAEQPGEPVADSGRPFSEGRPVAGEDPDYR